VRVLQRIGGPMAMLGATAGATLRRGVSLRQVLLAVHDLGNRSAPLVCAGMAFFGVVMVTIAHAQARRFTGNLTVVGPAYFELLIREFGPLTASVLAAARAGARDASELASMSVNEQVEALQMSAGDPLAELVAPRVLGGLIAFPVLALLGTATAALSAAAAAQWLFGVDGTAFLDPRYVDGGDLASGLLKGALCGLYVPLAAAWQGLRARGGATAVGHATTDGVVAAVLGVLFIDLLVAVAFRILRA
jgi:phospholipid/cholesterol/gamma-HCH transport system permease protein